MSSTVVNSCPRFNPPPSRKRARDNIHSHNQRHSSGASLSNLFAKIRRATRKKPPNAPLDPSEKLTTFLERPISTLFLRQICHAPASEIRTSELFNLQHFGEMSPFLSTKRPPPGISGFPPERIATNTANFIGFNGSGNVDHVPLFRLKFLVFSVGRVFFACKLPDVVNLGDHRPRLFDRSRRPPFGYLCVCCRISRLHRLQLRDS